MRNSIISNLQEIFYSGSHAFTGFIEPINEIAFLIDEKYLKLNKVFIAEKNDYFSLLDDKARLDQNSTADGGGQTHVALKVLVGKYLKEQRRLNPIYEHPFCGYYPDVMSGDNSVVIECGHTQNPEKMLAYFRQGKIRECIQVPYPTAEDVMISGNSFTPGDELYDFLVFLEQEQHSRLKKLMQKKNNQPK